MAASREGFGDPVTEVADFLSCEGTLVGTELELCVLKTLEDLAEVGEVLFLGSSEDDDVV